MLYIKSVIVKFKSIMKGTHNLSITKRTRCLKINESDLRCFTRRICFFINKQRVIIDDKNCQMVISKR